MAASLNKYKRLGKNTMFIFLGNMGPRLISFILMPFYTFWLSESDFGIQDILIVYSVLLIPYITLGLYEAVFVFPKDKDINSQRAYFTSSLIAVLLMQIGFAIVLISLPESLINKLLPEQLSNYVLILYLIVVIESYQRLMQAFTRGIDKMKVYSIAGIVYAVVNLSLALVLVSKYGLNGYWVALLTASLSSVIYNFIVIKGWRYIKISDSLKSSLKEMLYFSIPLIPNTTMWWIINSINRPLLIESVGLDGVGLYAVAGKFPSIISLIFTIFFSAFQISALEEFGKDNFCRFYTYVFRGLLCIQIILTVGFIFGGGILFELFIDEKFYSAVAYLPILCLGVGISNIACYVGISFTVVRKTKYFLYSAILGALVAVIANYVFIKEWGIMGACCSIIISQLSMSLYRYIKSIKYVQFEDVKRLLVQISLYFSIVVIYYLIPIRLLKYSLITFGLIIILLMNKDIYISICTKIKQRNINHFDSMN